MMSKQKNKKSNEKKNTKVFVFGIFIGLVIMIIFGNPFTGLIDYLIEMFR